MGLHVRGWIFWIHHCMTCTQHRNMRVLSASIALTASLPYPCPPEVGVPRIPCRPPTYIDDILKVGKLVGNYYVMTYTDYRALVLKYDPSASLIPTGCCGHPVTPFTTSAANTGSYTPPDPYVPPTFAAPMTLPPLKTQVANAAGAAGRLMKAAITGQPVKAEQDVVDFRQSVCDSCEFNLNNRCAKCGCYWKVKMQLATEHCPVGKW